MSRLIFSATKLPMLGKRGEIKPDEDGYYELVVGGLNTFNNTGSWYYTLEGCKELFGPGSLIHRRIANGCLKAEVGHPKIRPGEKEEDFFNRMLDIDLNNVCAHFKEVWIDETFGQKHPEYKNPNLVAIMAKVKPSGAKGKYLKEALDNKHENVCFSIRAIADEGYIKGKVVRVLKDVITIDLVNEGGILVASKWDSPATESIDNITIMKITKPLMERVSKHEHCNCIATESERAIHMYVMDKYFTPVKKEDPIYKRW